MARCGVFTGEALAYLGDWTEAIAAGEQRGHNAPAVAKAADSLRLAGVRLAIEPTEGVAPAATPVVPGLAASAAGALAAAGVLPFVLEPSTSPETEASPQTEALGAPDLTLAGFDLPLADEAAPASAEAALAAFAPLPEQQPVPPAAPVDAGEPSFGLSLDFDEPLAEPEPPPSVHDALEEPVLPEITPAPDEAAVSLETLLQRVPDLPAAEDLALTLPDGPEVREPAATEPAAFDLDLGSFDEPAAAFPALPELPTLDLPELASPLSAEPVLPQDEPLPGIEAVQPVPVPEVELVELDLADLQDVFDDAGPALAEPGTTAPPVADETPPIELPQPLLAEPVIGEAAVEPTATVSDDEQVKLIGPLRISIPLFNIFLNEADELSRRLCTELAEWSLEHERHPVPESSAALAHSLAGNSATVGYTDLSALARALEHALMRSHAAAHGRPGEAPLFNDAAEEIRRLLHQFAAGFLRPVDAELMARLAEHERLPQPLATEAAEPELEVSADAADAGDFDVVDALDAELFPIFEEEAEELLPQLQMRLREWLENPGNADAPAACMRTLHTFKGGARLAGAMRLGEMAHQLEATIEQMAVLAPVPVDLIEPLPAQADAMAAAFEALSHRPLPAPLHAPPQPAAAAELPAEIPAVLVAAAEPLDVDLQVGPDLELPLEALTGQASTEPVEPPAPAEPPRAPRPLPVIDWARFGTQDTAAPAPVERLQAAGAAVRVRAGLLDRLVNQAGEVSITRARIDADVKVMQSTLVDLTDSLERMRRQLRDIELQAETQISSRMEAAKAAAQTFDPLEMDRFTRFQELTRFMAESVNDVATLQRGLQRTLQSTEDELAAQARLTRELQDDLLRTRMVEFDSLSERLYRTVRQAAKETGKQVRLEIIGGAIEIDRGVLERMVGSFEHLLRNCVAHGVEPPEARQAAGKDATGLATVTVTQAGNEVAIEFGDDGSGLDLGRIRDRALERGLLSPGAHASDAELAQVIFHSGFSTAETVTELSGRGVGLDVVRAEVNAMGGRIETQSAPGQGTRFRLLLPLTTAVTQVVMLRCGSTTVAVPSTLVELVRRVPTVDVQRGYEQGVYEFAGEKLPFFWLAALLREGGRGDISVGRTQTVVIVRSASQRVAVHVDEVVGNQEVVVKNVGPQLSRLPGLAGVTLLPSGQVALIYNPVALATVYADAAHALSAPIHLAESVPSQAAPVVVRAPLVMVVDDSLTVRRVTQRLLVREGYRVVTAKDGLDALERLAEERPVALLSDIEMPRMDGFDLVRNVRADPRLAGLPVVMITSRIAQKHRDYAAELGVQHYLGKPYSEEELLSLVAGFAQAAKVH
jgi:chemosensory pili system protein ChpA (sensor histidine kinase/response regulator)